jgi:hypothetical protein
MTPQEFEEKYLPQPWGERDLQLLIQKRLRKFWILTAPDEVRVKTSVNRRIDISTWLTVYEVKRYLTRESIFHAAGQSEIYAHYGQRLFWIFRKKRVLIGLSPSDPQEYSAAVSVQHPCKHYFTLIVEKIDSRNTFMKLRVRNVGFKVHELQKLAM